MFPPKRFIRTDILNYRVAWDLNIKDRKAVFRCFLKVRLLYNPKCGPSVCKTRCEKKLTSHNPFQNRRLIFCPFTDEHLDISYFRQKLMLSSARICGKCHVWRHKNLSFLKRFFSTYPLILPLKTYFNDVTHDTFRISKL